MSRLAIVVAGAAGRMGRALMAEVLATPSAVLLGGLERADHPDLGADLGVLAGAAPIGIPLSADPLALIVKAGAILDFTTPSTSVALAALAAQARIVHVVGTTGFSPADEAQIAAAARHAGIVKSGNTSLGVSVLAALVEKAARALGPMFDIEITEMHHKHKVDAPSGTALMLGRAAAAGRGQPLEALRLPPREGHTGPRPEGPIGFAALRGGSVVGDHSVIFAGAGERIVLSHIAEDRAIFARGAVRAALWAEGQPRGLYSMADVLGL
jgi:4-hydroxy-tetrahydrodipicolinate reductase